MKDDGMDGAKLGRILTEERENKLRKGAPIAFCGFLGGDESERAILGMASTENQGSAQ